MRWTPGMGALGVGLLLGVAVAVAAAAVNRPKEHRGKSSAPTNIPVLHGSPNICDPLPGSEGWCGDGKQADAAKLHGPQAVAALPGGGFLIADTGNNVIRKVSRSGVITTVAGDAFPGFTGSDVPAVDAELNGPSGVVALPHGGFLIADTGNHVIREVRPDGRIVTIAGTGKDGSAGDGRPASRASLQSPQGLAITPDGTILIADPPANTVRRITPNGRIEAFAGTGRPGYGGDGGPATAAELDYPTGVAVGRDGTVLIADDGNARIRSVARNGTIATVAGGGASPAPTATTPGTTPATTTTTPTTTTTTPTTTATTRTIATPTGTTVTTPLPPGSTGTGTTGGRVHSALQFELNGPTGVAPIAGGGFVIADGPVVERVFPDGTAQVVAGVGKPVYEATSGPATSTGLADATAVATESNGSVLIADQNTNRVRKLDQAGRLSTAAGSGTGQLQVTVGSDTCTNPSRRPPWDSFYLVPAQTPTTQSLTGQPIHAEFYTSTRAAIVITILQQDRMITRWYRQVPATGISPDTVKLGKPPAPGSYDMVLRGAAEFHGHMLHNCARLTLNVVRG
ncbi:MAG TPA: hypothetical protein VGI55_05350 [Solirubrobacteraceae bacterium]